jgi:SAM-dependent methyltransferase
VDAAIARALNRINLAFYGDPARAAAFSATREGAWPGWHRLHEVLDAEGLPAGARVLDLACGNARLGRFLAERRPGLHYLGVDASPALLERALAGAPPGIPASAWRFATVDLVEDDLAATLAGRRFDLAACFGVLHHLPGRARRLRTLALLLESLAPRGLLAVTCWQLAQFARFRGRITTWQEWNASAAEPIDPARLESGDHLLPFTSGGIAGHRYVHFAHEEETAELLAELPCEPVAGFVADGAQGNLNRYFVVRPRA